jgi:hypothetical protein
MWAQGLTIGLLIVAGALTHKSKFRDEEKVGLCSVHLDNTMLMTELFFARLKLITHGETSCV